MKKAALIINLDSGTGKARELRDDIIAKLKESFEIVDVRETEKAGDGADFATAARLEGFDAVFAAGGDGTISEVVQGLLTGCAEREPLPALGMFPGGTGNGLMRTLGLPRTIEQTLEESEFRTTKCIDVGYVNDIPFVYTVTVGSLPEGIREVSSEDKARFGPLAYTFSELKRIGQDEQRCLEIAHSGVKETLTVNSLVVFSANVMADQVVGNYDIEPDDGWLHMLLLKSASVSALLKIIPSALAGDIEDNEEVRYIRAREMTIASLDGPLESGRDGDTGSDLPLTLTIEPRKLAVYID